MVAYLKTQLVLELLNNFSNLSTVAYKGVAYKKIIVYWILKLESSNTINFACQKVGGGHGPRNPWFCRPCSVIMWFLIKKKKRCFPRQWQTCSTERICKDNNSLFRDRYSFHSIHNPICCCVSNNLGRTEVDNGTKLFFIYVGSNIEFPCVLYSDISIKKIKHCLNR